MTDSGTGRANQRARTKRAIIDAARELIASAGPVSMPLVAEKALVSEATAYRYFSDLQTLIREALDELWPSATEMMEPIAAVTDPGERVAYAAEQLLRGVVRFEGSTRAMIAATITHSESAARDRPGYRFALIDQALDPVAHQLVGGQSELAELKRRLAVVLSPESMFTLIDFCSLGAEEAIATLVNLVRELTALTSK